MLNNYSLSTAWNCLKYFDGKSIAREITALGFSSIELNFQFTKSKLAGIFALVQKKELAVSSVHNYCPFPEAEDYEQCNPDVPSLASHKENERKAAVTYTKHSIDTARKLHAPVVVVHLGKVSSKPRTRDLIDLYCKEGSESKIFRSLRNEAIDERGQKKKEHFDALCTSCRELIPYAKRNRILLGVENRFHYREFPLPDEMDTLFNYFGDNTLRYWHDIGHAFILEKLGFYPECYYFETFYKKMVGIHIHDIIRMEDHKAPFDGDFDWLFLKKFDLHDVIKVFEIHAPYSGEAIRESVKKFNMHVDT